MKKLLAISLIILFTCLSLPAMSQSFKLDEATISDVHKALQSGQISCVDLVDSYLLKIKRYNLAMSRGAAINAIATINPNVLAQAENLDKTYQKTGKLVGKLHCIPVVIKDNFDSYDSPSTSGSLSMLGSQPYQDAFLVQQLRSAGAIILAKGAMDEFASGVSGISSRTGRIGNVYDPLENPGGSSGGPAAAVSANFAMLGLGSDNSGSVRIPAAFNGLYGLRPSTGLLSQSGIFPRGNLDGVAGPLARSVRDLAIMLSVMAKPDVKDQKTQKAVYQNYMRYLSKDALKGKKIGVIKIVGTRDVYAKATPEAMRVFDKSKQIFKRLGATLVPVELKEFNNNRENNMAGENQDINNYLKSFASTRRNLTDICWSNRTRTFGKNVQECLAFIASGDKKYGKSYKKALAIFSYNLKYVTEVMRKNKLDALLIPIATTGMATYNARAINTWQASVSSNSGLPAVAFIAGFTEVKPIMPVGMELVGDNYDEAKLLGMAYAYEQAMPRLAPKLGKESQALVAMNIPELNNLFTALGYQGYQQILKNGKPEDLTPTKFNTIIKSLLILK